MHNGQNKIVGGIAMDKTKEKKGGYFFSFWKHILIPNFAEKIFWSGLRINKIFWLSVSIQC